MRSAWEAPRRVPYCWAAAGCVTVRWVAVDSAAVDWTAAGLLTFGFAGLATFAGVLSGARRVIGSLGPRSYMSTALSSPGASRRAVISRALGVAAGAAAAGAGRRNSDTAA